MNRQISVADLAKIADQLLLRERPDAEPLQKIDEGPRAMLDQFAFGLRFGDVDRDQAPCCRLANVGWQSRNTRAPRAVRSVRTETSPAVRRRSGLIPSWRPFATISPLEARLRIRSGDRPSTSRKTTASISDPSSASQLAPWAEISPTSVVPDRSSFGSRSSTAAADIVFGVCAMRCRITCPSQAVKSAVGGTLPSASERSTCVWAFTKPGKIATLPRS